MAYQDLNTANTAEKMLPLDMDYLPEFFQQKARREINYSPEISEKKLRTLKELIANEKELKVLGDTELLTFLTCRKFNVEKTVDHLKRFVKYRKDFPEVIFTRIPTLDELSVFMTTGFTTVLPWRCKDGCAVIYSNFANWNPKLHNVDAIKQFYGFMISQCLRKPMTQVNGFKVIINLDFSLALMKICTPRNMRIFTYGIFVISPARFKEIHLLNFGVGKILWQAAKIFLPAKLKDRVHIHKTCDSLKQFFPEDVLPQNIGGSLKDYDMTWFIKKYYSPEEMSLWGF